MTRVALLDVNVLLALFNPDHVHHEVAHDWDGRFATLDRNIPLAAVVGATRETLAVVSAVDEADL